MLIDFIVVWLFSKGYENNLSFLRVLSAHNQILIFNTLKSIKKKTNKQTKNSILSIWKYNKTEVVSKYWVVTEGTVTK